MIINLEVAQKLHDLHLYLEPGSQILGQGKLSPYLRMAPGTQLLFSTMGSFSYSQSSIINSTVGNYCSIAHAVDWVGCHHLDRITTSPITIIPTDRAFDRLFEGFSNRTPFDAQKHSWGRLTIGSDVWIGSHVIFMPNLSIGDGAVIGAGAVVTRDVEPYTIVGGIPARPIRKRFSDAVIERIMKLRWVDYDWRGFDIHWNDLERSLDEIESLISSAPRISYLVEYLADNKEIKIKFTPPEEKE